MLWSHDTDAIDRAVELHVGDVQSSRQSATSSSGEPDQILRGATRTDLVPVGLKLNEAFADTRLRSPRAGSSLPPIESLRAYICLRCLRHGTPLRENMTSPTKPEVRNVLLRYCRTIEIR